MSGPPKLKPCPFCGRAADMHEQHEESSEELVAGYGLDVDTSTTGYSAGCGNCEIYTVPHIKPEFSASQWNTRAPQIPEELLERLDWMVSEINRMKVGDGSIVDQLLCDLHAALQGDQT